MRKPIPYIFAFILVGLHLSCSDAEIVSGTFHGRIYATDTIDADVKVTAVNDGIIRLDVTGPATNGGYVEYAELTRNADDAYGLKWYSDPGITGTLVLSGYYFDGYLVFDSSTHQYKFSGGKE